MREDGSWTRAGEYEPAHFEKWKITRDKQLPVMVMLGEHCPYAVHKLRI